MITKKENNWLSHFDPKTVLMTSEFWDFNESTRSIARSIIEPEKDVTKEGVTEISSQEQYDKKGDGVGSVRDPEEEGEKIDGDATSQNGIGDELKTEGQEKDSKLSIVINGLEVEINGNNIKYNEFMDYSDFSDLLYETYPTYPGIEIVDELLYYMESSYVDRNLAQRLFMHFKGQEQDGKMSKDGAEEFLLRAEELMDLSDGSLKPEDSSMSITYDFSKDAMKFPNVFNAMKENAYNSRGFAQIENMGILTKLQFTAKDIAEKVRRGLRPKKMLGAGKEDEVKEVDSEERPAAPTAEQPDKNEFWEKTLDPNAYPQDPQSSKVKEESGDRSKEKTAKEMVDEIWQQVLDEAKDDRDGL